MGGFSVLRGRRGRGGEGRGGEGRGGEGRGGEGREGEGRGRGERKMTILMHMQDYHSSN